MISQLTGQKTEILTAGQALTTAIEGGVSTAIAAQPEQFVRSMPPLLTDDFESYANDSDIHKHGPWWLFNGMGAYQRARAVEPAASSTHIFGRRVVELRDSYGSPKFAAPLLQGRIAPGNVPQDLRIQFDFRRLDAETAPRVTLHNASWQLVLGPEVRLLESSAAPLAPIDLNQWYRLTLSVPSGAKGGKLGVRLDKLVGDQFVDPVTTEYQVGPSHANDTIDFTYLSDPQQPKAGAWQIDNLRVELAD
ncbi:MAG: hypothetical protein K8T91_16990 [Planctomycetes bacterium]|nr:hypothetical protein [Planctomycetota bacterium]